MADLPIEVIETLDMSEVCILLGDRDIIIYKQKKKIDSLMKQIEEMSNVITQLNKDKK